MHGVDWAKMKTKYRPMAIDSENKDEFHNIIRQMLAELGASHLGISGGTRDLGATPSRAATGHLGLEFSQTPEKDGSRKITSIVANSSADKAGLRVGDVVTMIKGRTLKADTNLDKLLDGTVGNKVSIVYKPMTASGLGLTKNTSVTAIGFGQLSQLYYRNWISTCEHRVKKGSKAIKGEIGYIHLNAMNPQNLARFQQTVQRWNSNKRIKAMILDVRNNGGGNIHQQLMQILVNKPLATVRMRGGPKVVQPGLYWDKPVVVLINERSFSDAEVFPYMFQAAGCGPVIGVATPGGVIGTRDITLSDGSRFRVPRVGFWGMDGTNLEGLGVQPDIVVEESTEDRLNGRDPQLAKAIEVVTGKVNARANKKKTAKPATTKKPETGKKPEPTKPAPKPAATPKPAKPQPSPAQASAKNPLADVRVGEWVRYRVTMPGATESGMLLIKVKSVTADEVEFEKTVESGNAMMPIPEKMPRKSLLDSLASYGKLLSHSIVQDAEIKGNRAELLTAVMQLPDGSRSEMFFSNHLPAMGLWKLMIRNQVVMEAVEWGVPAAMVLPKPEAPATADPKPAAPAKAETAAAAPTHPLADAKVGEWTKVRHTRGGVEFEVTQRVTDVSDEEVTLAATLMRDGRNFPARPRTRKRPTELKAPGDMEATFTKETVTINDQKLECIVMTIEDDGVTQKVWFCLKIPVDGLVKVERDGDVVAELLEWGTEEE